MKTEIEAKFLEINSSQLREYLHQLGAVLVYPERLMVRETFDYPNNSLREIGGWVRLRSEGKKISLAYKQLNDRTLHGTKEVEVTVSDYDSAKDFLLNLGLVARSIQESKRELWKLGEAEITIDTWPWIPTFCEVEGLDESTVKNVAEKLGFEWDQALYGSVEVVYQNYYNVTEEAVWSWSEIRFVPVPDFLKNKRK